MTFKESLQSKAITLCFLGIGFLLVCALFVITQTSLVLLLVCGLLYWILIFLWLYITYYCEKKKLNTLENLIQTLDAPYLIGELIPAPVNALEKQYYELMKTISFSAIEEISSIRAEKDAYYNYVESWIHEMKTPLTACSLMLVNHSDPCKLKRELKKAENLTESILYYARLRTAEKDTLIQEFHLSSLADEAVKDQMDLLISAGIRVKVHGDSIVRSDKKILFFILKQLLINCSKYCPGGQIEIAADSGCLTVKDNGIGIPDYEIRRVTERGFTGTNGRTHGTSTGMGLYLVSEFCKQLDISFHISSQYGSYTSVSLLFPDITKM
nr:sensor histidine kinase [uncultured Sellimonas sp.]